MQFNSIYPFVTGWLFKIELTDESEIMKLMTEDQYKEFLRTQESH